MPTIEEIEENFSFLTDWEDRYGYIIDLGKKLPVMNEQDKSEESRVHGCQSQVWLVAQTLTSEKGPVVNITADSDAFIVKGLIAILLSIYQHQPLTRIRDLDAEKHFKTLGLDQHLSPTRRNGLFSMVERVQKLAQQMRGTTN